MEIKNARVASTSLGGWDESVPSTTNRLTIGLVFEGDDWGQGTGIFGGSIEEFVTQVLYVLEATDWSKIKGLPCRVHREDGRIVGIENIIKARWFFFNSLYK